MHEGYLRVDKRGRIVEMNRRFLKMLGYTASDILHLRRKDLTPPKWRKIDSSVLKKLADKGGSLVYQKEYRRNNGSTFPVELRAFVHRDSKKQACGAWALIRDISDSRRLEQTNQQLCAMTAQLARAGEQERQRLAQLLHDHLQQLLVGARYSLQSIHCPECLEKIKTIDTTLAQCVQTSRTLTTELSPHLLYELGLIPTLKWLGREFLDKHGLRVKVMLRGKKPSMEDDVRAALFHATRELLFNVVKHANTHHATVRLHSTPDRSFHITVSDRGAGFDPQKQRLQGCTSHFGIFNLQERMEALGGSIKIKSAPGRGTSITLILPKQPPRNSKRTSLTPGIA
jgi:PAS domain S-box-containing protein